MMEPKEIIDRLKNLRLSTRDTEALDEAIEFIERHRHGFLCPRCRLVVSDHSPTISPLIRE